MKKGTAILLCTSMMLLAAGCADNASSSANPDTESVNSSQESPSDINSVISSEESSETTSVDSTDESSVTTSAASAEESSESKPVTASEDGFKVDGTKLLDANGNEFIMRGINHAHTWYLKEDTTAIKAIADTGANTVRIVCSDGQQWTKDSREMLETVIDLCIDNEMIAVVEVHDATGKDDISALRHATDYWIEMKDVLIGKEQYVILNIANEWAGSWDGALWRDGYIEAIPKLREAGIKNTLLVDAGGWAQYAKSIHDYGEEVFNSDPDKNTMFAVHMYGTAGKNSQTIEYNLGNVTDKGLCVIVGEFGYNHTDGDVDEDYIMEYCQNNGIGYLGWSWKGNSGGVEYLDIANAWDGSVLSSDWGEKLINGENGIRKTSVKCSIFTSEQ